MGESNQINRNKYVEQTGRQKAREGGFCNEKGKNSLQTGYTDRSGFKESAGGTGGLGKAMT